jgi:hypothetical protein
VSQPLDRGASLPTLGAINQSAGELWVNNPFLLAQKGDNLSAYERNRLFLNLAGQTFIDASFASQADIDSDSRSVVAADFDGDGAPDLLVGSVGGGPLRLFRNRFPRIAQRVLLELVGTRSNRAGIGARVVAHCSGRQIVRDLFPASGFMGSGPAGLLLGVGKANQIDRLTIRWPSGETQELRNLPVNQRITITEGKPDIRTAELASPPRR